MFRRSVLVLAVLALARPARSNPEETITDFHRGLTAGERALLQPIFHDSISYDRIQVIRGKFMFQPDHVYMTPRGNIYAPGDLWEDDFASPRVSPFLRAIFVHEITHVWQYENGMDLIAAGVAVFAKTNGAYEKAYPYTLDRARDLVDYGMEQQASIVEDYYLITTLHREPQRLENRGLDTTTRDRLYSAVLGKFIGNARYARAMSSSDVATRHAEAAKTSPPSTSQTCETEAQLKENARHLCGWRFAGH
jgi:hypothetical protein